jgi:basic membrane protein A and related proteins
VKSFRWYTFFVLVLITFSTWGCASRSVPASQQIRVGLVADTGGVNDKSYNQSAWAGVEKAANEFGWDARYVESKQPTDYEKNIDLFASQGFDVIVTIGFFMGDATAAKAIQYPDVRFAIVDFPYFPTQGSYPCDETKQDCYDDGGLSNVTSLMFREDQLGFLAGVLAGGMSKTGTICSVSGIDVPSVIRFVTGYQNGALWIEPGTNPLNVYIPSFSDPARGKETGLSMIGQGCDVLFGIGGNTGNGGLLAAKESGIMAIGIDVDQYYSYPEVSSALLSSAAKNIDIAVYQYLKSFYEGTAQPGIITASVENGGIGLTPFHDWEERIPAEVKAKIQEAADGLRNGTIKTGID